MINLINRSKEDVPILINLFDIEFNATPEDIRKIYSDVKIDNITQPKHGIYLLELTREEALKIVEIGPKVTPSLLSDSTRLSITDPSS